MRASNAASLDSQLQWAYYACRGDLTGVLTGKYFHLVVDALLSSIDSFYD
jgi:hypothetical protein